MRRMRIVADSSCDLFVIPGLEFAAAPMKIITDEREFVDDEKLDTADMVEYLGKLKGKSKSSCPNTSDWLEAFGGADDIICITITSALSGSYNSACTAKQLYEDENPGKRVFVIDTFSAGPELTLIAEKLGELICEGLEYSDICDVIEEYMKHTGLLFMLKSLRTFANNGRVSPITAKLVGIAGICIVGKASDLGTLEPLHKCRGEKSSLEKLVSELEKHGYSSGKISIGHCFNEAAAQTLGDMILAKYPGATVEIHNLRGLCSFYAEKGGVLVGYEKN